MVTTRGIWTPDASNGYQLTQDLAAMAASIAQLIPVGKIDVYAGQTAPSGWLLCHGQAYLRADYPELFNVIGLSYGPADGLSFVLPDLRGRVPVGFDSRQGEFDTVGKSGGAKVHTLTVAQMPSHNHPIDGPSGLGGRLSGTNAAPGYGGGTGAGYTPWFGGGYNAQPAFYHPAGGGQPHNNLQPYLTINYIIKAQ